jgi:hypothetical protein
MAYPGSTGYDPKESGGGAPIVRNGGPLVGIQAISIDVGEVLAQGGDPVVDPFLMPFGGCFTVVPSGTTTYEADDRNHDIQTTGGLTDTFPLTSASGGGTLPACDNVGANVVWIKALDGPNAGYPLAFQLVLNDETSACVS